MEEDKKEENVTSEVKDKDTSTLLVDENNKIIDIYDLIEQNNESPTVIRIKNLMKYGATIEQIAQKYDDLSNGGISNIDVALENLEKAYKDIAIGISKAPNGIVIDLRTGTPDPVKSAEQAQRLGIDRDGNYISNSSSTIQMVDNAFQENFDDKKIVEEMPLRYDSDNWKADVFSKANDDRLITESMKDIMKEMDNKNFSDSFNEEVNKALANIESKNPILMEFAMLIEESQKNPGMNENEINSFIEKYSQYKSEFSKIIENGIDSNELNLYKDSVAKKSLADIASKIEGMSKDEIASMSEDNRRNILAMGLSIVNMGATSGYLEQIESMVRTVYPDIDSLFDFEKIAEKCIPLGQILENSTIDKNEIDKTLGIDIKELESNLSTPFGEVAKKLGIKPEEIIEKLQITEDNISKLVMDFGMESLNRFAKNGNKSILEVKEGKIKNEEYNSYFKENSELLNVESINKTPHELYFKNSKIPYSKINDTTIKATNAGCRSVSWIESRDELTTLEYLSLVNRKDKLIAKQELRKNDDNIKLELEELEKSIKEFEDNHTDFNKESYFQDGKLKTEYKNRINTFESAKFRGDILSNFIEDESKAPNLKGYTNLSDADKTKYLRDTLYGLADKSPIMKKMAMRRLEIISTNEKNFLSFDENGNPQVNEALFLQECEKVGVVTDKNKDILHNNDTYIKERTEYARNKLQEYEKMPDECFVKIETKTEGKKLENLEDKVRQIDKIKIMNRLRVKQAQRNGDIQENEIKAEEINFNEKGRILSQDEVTDLVALTKKNMFLDMFSKDKKEFESKISDMVNDEPIIAHESLKEFISNPENQSIKDAQDKIMIMQERIKEAEKEKLKKAFSKDGGDFKDSVVDLVKINPSVAKEFLKEFIESPESSDIKDLYFKAGVLNNVIKDAQGIKSNDDKDKVLSGKEADLGTLINDNGPKITDDKSNEKAQEDDDLSL